MSALVERAGNRSGEIYARQGQPDVAIDFDVHYFVQQLDGEPKVFGWVSGDEQALLRKHGVI